MRKALLLAFVFLTTFAAFGQEFSNKGRDFWLCFPQHVPNGANTFATLSIFITSDQASSGTITMPNGAFSGTFNIAANGIQEIQIPWNASIHIGNVESSNETITQILKKALHIKVNPGQPAVVAYAQQWAGARSAATLLLPVNVLGKKYYSISFAQNGNNGQGYNARSQFQIIATQDNTNVEITPVKNGVKGTKFTVNLPLTGDMIQYQSPDAAAATQDLTGTIIESVASGTGGCLPIAVFSGSSNITFGNAAVPPSIPACSGGSYDPLWQQLYPASSWGKNFGFIPFADYLVRGNPYRVMAAEDNTNVYFNGTFVANLSAGQIYPSAFTGNPATLLTPTYITSDKPICVAQYAQADACSGQTGPANQRVGDPDMVILNPIEQNISDITVFSSTRQNISRQYVNVLLQDAAISSFKISRNGGPLNPPAGTWQSFGAALPGYSYLRESLTGINSARIVADSGFNAIAYGWGNVESYAYSAGTNVKDFSKELELETTYGIETSASVCTNAPFKFKFYIPDSTAGTATTPPVAIRFDSLKWDLTNRSIIVPNNFPIMVYPPGPPPATVAIDSITIKNGIRVAWYSLPTTYFFNAAGLDTLLVTGYTSTNEGCGTNRELEFKIQISDPPTVSFNAVIPGCYLDSVRVTETTPQLPKATYRQWWEFYDPVGNITTVYSGNGIRYKAHLFTSPGSIALGTAKRIRHASITTPGCLSDTIVQIIEIPDIPNATIAGNTTVCINSVPSVPVTFTGTGGTAEYIFSYKLNGGATLTTPPSTGGSYTINAPANVAGTFTYDLVGVTNALPVGTPCTRAITGQSVIVNILPDHAIALGSGNPNQTVCVNNAITPFTLTLSGGATNIAAPAGLPPGVTANVVGNTVTISGTPTTAVGSPFNYTITTTGNACLTATFTGTITVNPDHTISLTGGTADQTVCINTPIAPITLTLGGGATGITPAGLPPGVTATVVGNTVTISGAPTSTAGSPYNYSLTTTGNSCVTANFTGSLIVNPDHAIALAGGNPNQTVCVNVAITPFTLTLSGGANNIAAPVNLPPGVTANVVGNTVTISGTPTLAGSYPYSITTSGNSCVTANFTGTINVSPDHAISLTGGTANQTVCINTLIAPITLTLGGGATGITPAGLPPGVTATVVGNTVTISGAPTSTAGSPYNYTLTTTGNSCVTANFTGSITVNPDHAIALAGGNPNQTVCVNVAITPFTLTLSGGATNIALPSNLPPGVTANVVGNTVTISGTPTLAGNYPYGITTTGNSCVAANFNGTINVTADATIALTSAVGTDNQTVCRNITITDIDYATGGSATGANITWIPAAPAGITFTALGGGNFRIAGTPTVVGTQTYTYTITTTGPCVKPAATGTITVNALPVATFSVPPPSCANNMVVFTNSSTPNAGPVTTWAWDFGDPNANAGNPNTSSAQNPTHFYTVPGTYTATLHIVNSNGCISTPDASVTFVVNDTPRAGFIVPDVCINDVATVFTDTSKITVGTINRPLNQWNYGDPGSGPLNNSVGINGSHLYTSTGIYQVTQIVTSALGCKDTIVLPITINSADPVSNFTAANSCSSDSVDLRNLSTVGFGSVTRLDIYWDFAGAPLAFQTITSPAFNGIYRHKYPTLQTTQTYTIKMIAYSGVICSNTTTKTVTVYATPRVQFNNIPATCYLVAPFQLTQGSEIGGVPGTGTYSGPGITNPNGTFNPQLAGIGTHNIKYTWTASNPGACIDTLTRTITVLDTAHAAFGVTLPSCEQIPTSFTNQSTAPASVNLASTVWDFGDASGPQTFAIAAPVTHLYAGPGTYTVTMHNVSDHLPVGCLSTDTSAVITIDANHAIAWDAASGNENQSLCINNPIVPIRYNLSGGASGVTVTGLPAGVTYSVTGTTLTITGAPSPAAGGPLFPFTIVTTGNTCAVANASGSINVLPDHAISLVAGSDTAQSVCVNTPIDDIVYNLGGGATGVTIANLPPGVTYNVVGNILTISGTPTSSAGGPMFNFAIQTTGNACVKANTIGEILVNDYPVPAFAFDKASYCIPNANVGFINNTTPAPLSNHTYAWDFGDGIFSSAASPTHLYTSEGPFNVTLKARSTVLLNHGVIGCESNKVNLLNIIHPQPKADFVFSKPSVCVGDNVVLTDATDGKDGLITQWHWDMGDGVTKVTNPVPYTFKDTITYTITMYSINSPHGCNSDTISKTFTVYPYPTGNAGTDKFVLEGGSVELDATAYGRQPQYAWTPVQYLTDSKILRPRVVNPKTDMTYRLTITGKGGCQFSDDVFVKLLKFPAIPNTFTPNGDGINDQWRIDYLNTYPDNRVQIFTRAGKLVFESRGYNKPWDGTLKGKPLPFDTYYYIIEPGNGRDPITGYVTILK